MKTIRSLTLAILIALFPFSDIISQEDTGCDGFRTQTPGGWGAPANGNNPGVYRDMHFDDAFPEGLTIGCGDNTLTLTSAQAVEDYLPCGGPPASIDGSFTDPDCLGNVLTGHLVALTLSLTFDAFDPDFGESDLWLGDLWVNNGMFEGYTVEEVLMLGNSILGGCDDAYSASSLTGVLDMINQNYVDGEINNGNLDCEEEECEDDEAPELIWGPEDTMIECGSGLPDEAPIFEDNSGSFEVFYNEEYDATECTGVYIRTWVAIDDCENSTSYTQVVGVEDTQAPVLSGCPDNMEVDGPDDVPPPADVSAEDVCDGTVEVVYEESTDVSDTGSSCVLLDAEDPFDPNWSLVLFNNLGLDEDYYSVTSGVFDQWEDEEGIVHASIIATFESLSIENCGWEATVFLNNGLNWDDWSTQDFPASYKDDANQVTDEYLDWMYFIISNESVLEGTGIHEGSTLTLSHAPSNMFYGFQVGENANNIGPGYGSGGWFFYSGNLVNTEEGTDQEVSGTGDFAFIHQCCDATVITRTWTAMDCSGNSSSCTQTITYCIEEDPGIVADSEDIVTIQADLNKDGAVNTTDMLDLLKELGCQDDCGDPDLDSDGDVDTTDILDFLTVYGWPFGQ